MDGQPRAVRLVGSEGPPIPEVGEGGIDLSLIRWMLSLTPLQRLEVLQDFVDSVRELRRGRSD